MRRLLSIVTLTFLASMVLLAFAVPSFAEEAPADHVVVAEDADHAEAEDADHAEEAEADHAEDAAHAEDDSDQWLGLKGALVAGVLLGLGAFIASGTKGLGEEAHH